jgi:hypothetical protein
MRILVAGFVLLALSGCASTVNLEPAEGSNDPGCAQVMVRLPSQLGGLEERYTNAQATAAWGDPAAVLLRCGLEPVEVSPLQCVTAGGIDWLVDDALAPSYRFISYARYPAVEVIVDSDNASGITSLEGLSGAVAQLPATKACTAP